MTDSDARDSVWIVEPGYPELDHRQEFGAVVIYDPDSPATRWIASEDAIEMGNIGGSRGGGD